jgi:hypothetical protein
LDETKIAEGLILISIQRLVHRTNGDFLYYSLTNGWGWLTVKDSAEKTGVKSKFKDFMVVFGGKIIASKALLRVPYRYSPTEQ